MTGFFLLPPYIGVFYYIGFYYIGVRLYLHCLLYTSDAADEEDSVDLGGRRIIKKVDWFLDALFCCQFSCL